ncbi:MAG: alpha-glucosidase [Thermotogaceae bacterium]|nr:alpha-glucosidase [Thermotogaceae bacterium]
MVKEVRKLDVKCDSNVLIFSCNDFLLKHSQESPLFYVGKGEDEFTMYHGNFDIQKFYDSKIPLRKYNVISKSQLREEYSSQNELKCEFYSDSGEQLVCTFLYTSNYPETLEIIIESFSEGLNRLWIHIHASENEEIYGCGEQYSYLALRGKRVPLWSSEQGVGRNKKDLITHFANFKDNAGGDWWTTYFPQPAYISSRNYYCIVHDYSYMEFDFSHKDFHELEIHNIPQRISFGSYDSLYDVTTALTHTLDTPSTLPDWLYDGVILGLQGGTDVVMPKIKAALEKGLKISGMWIQDWEGKRVTTFGKQLMWNWVYDGMLYPELPSTISQLSKMGIKTLGYINPFLALEGSLYEEASKRNLLVKRTDGSEYHVVVTTFPAAVLDLTNPETREWIKGIIKQNMIGMGLSGWMADFGEYLPTDAMLYNGADAQQYHNRYPVEWAKVNREAVEEAGKIGDVVFFMRAGGLGSSKYSTLFWHGDQLVNWSKDDGLPSVIVAALSMTMSGMGLTHSDIGGYTTFAKNVPELIWTKRTKELFMRWAEQAAFTPIMRTHEGNWPDENWQFDSDEETLLHFAMMSNIHAKLKPYIKSLVESYCKNYEPIIMPLNLIYKMDNIVDNIEECKYEYLFGKDLLVAPVLEPNTEEWEVVLPPDAWIHMWSGKRYDGGRHKVSAPLGHPPVFYRDASHWKKLFEEVGDMV